MTIENRETFFARLQPLLAPSRFMDCEWAYATAKGQHHWQKRKEKDANGQHIRYLEHLRATAIILIDELEIIDPDMICAAWMHDLCEDTKYFTPRHLEYKFNTNVATMVTMLTKNPAEGYYERLMKFATVPVLIVKGCDNLSNLRTLKDCTPEFRAKQVRQSRAHVFPLMDRAVHLAKGTPYLNAAYKIRDLLESQVTTLEAG